MLLRSRWHMWPWPPLRRVKTHWPTFWFSGSSMPRTWPRTFLFGRMGNVKEPPQCLLFDRPWPTFATVMHSYMTDLKLSIIISKAITTIVKPTSKLVHSEVLLTSSSTNITLTLWKSVKVAWPNFRLFSSGTHINLRTAYILGRLICLTESLHTR